MRVRPFVIVAFASLALQLSGGAPPVSAKSSDPCRTAGSNADIRECYYDNEKRVNADADSLAAKFAAEFHEEAQNPINGPVVNELLEKAAAEVVHSQKAWKHYRDHHCQAVDDSWTTGSGGGTAHEACLFKLGQQRLKELHSAFDSFQPSKIQRR